MKILLVEDSQRLLRSLGQGLKKLGYAVDLAARRRGGARPRRDLRLPRHRPRPDAARAARSRGPAPAPDPGQRRARPDPVGPRRRGRPGARASSWARTTTSSSPSPSTELCARIQALVRRRHQAKNPIIRLGSLEIDAARRQVSRDGERAAPDAERVRPAGAPRLPARPRLLEGAAGRAPAPERFGRVEQRRRGPRLGPPQEDPRATESPRSCARGGDSATSSSRMGSLRTRLFVYLIGGAAARRSSSPDSSLRTIVADALQREFDRALLAKARGLVALTEQEGGQIEFEFDPEHMPEFGAGAEPEYFELWLADGSLIQRSPSFDASDQTRAASLVRSPAPGDDAERSGTFACPTAAGDARSRSISSRPSTRRTSRATPGGRRAAPRAVGVGPDGDPARRARARAARRRDPPPGADRSSGSASA